MRYLFFYLPFLFSYNLYSQLSFKEVSHSNNFNHTFFSETFGGAGLSFVDFDNDGLDDITIPSNQEKKVYFFKNNGNGFDQININIEISGDVKQIIWVDYDNDYDNDLYLSSYNGINRLYENKGFLNFEDVTKSLNLPDSISKSFGAAWADINNDGFLDLYQSYYLSDDSVNQAHLFLSDSSSSFTNITVSSGLYEINKLPFCASFLDINNDNLQDLYIASDRETGNSLYLNNGNETFLDISSPSNTGVKMDGMSVTVGDINNDTYFDIYSTNLDLSSKMFINNKDLTFTDVADDLGVGFNGIGWGAQFEDFDLDGFEDLYVSGGYTGSNTISSSFYFNKNGTDFEKDNSIGFEGDTVSSFGNAIGDFNNDGLPDIAVLNHFPAKSFLFENNYNGNNKWIKVILKGIESNADAYGSKVVLYSDNLVLSRTLLSTEGFISQNSKSIFFGVEENQNVDSLFVFWPSGITDKIFDVEINTTISIIEGSTFYPPKIISTSKYICENSSVTLKSAFDYINYKWSNGDTTPEITVSEEGNYYLEVIDENGNSHFSDTIYLTLSKSPIFDVEVKNITTDHSSSVTILGLEDTINYFTSIDGGDYSYNLFEYTNLTSGNHTLSVLTENGCENSLSFEVLNFVKDNSNYDDNYTIARKWIDVLLESIRNDFARPTVHARNLFHFSAMLYDIFYLYESFLGNNNLKPYLINQDIDGINYFLDFDKISINNENDIDELISYASNNFLKERFKNSPFFMSSFEIMDSLMITMDFDYNDFDDNYSDSKLSSVGNYISNQYLLYGKNDNSNEDNNYENLHYSPVNPPLNLSSSGNPNIIDPNRWQSLEIDGFIDQSGNPIQGIPKFISPEWGNVKPFALSNDNLIIKVRDENTYKIYYDPGPPPYLDTLNQGVMDSLFKRSFSMVSIWSSHLDRNDGVMWDISPNSIGNLQSYPTNIFEYENLYNYFDGGDNGEGYNLNPFTNQPYENQIVPRGDYTRVLAEFWADGPDSETPPGHWFTILNYVNENKNLIKKFEGTGEILSDLEWDIKSYFLLGGALHDAAISAWSIKGFYDYVRPISAIRYLGENYKKPENSFDIINGYVEIVNDEDSLYYLDNDNLGKIKLYTWRGFDNQNFNIEEKGSGWILAENWWPYQRPTFVTPPFAGYVSGHSTFSAAAATILEMLTGDEYFPGGIGEFEIKKNEFLVFENGPSVDMVLQWAKYRDAADQCSLSRIWGGIHPYLDDLPGRYIGKDIGNNAFELGKSYFSNDEKITSIENITYNINVFPNPTNYNKTLNIINESNKLIKSILIYENNGKQIESNIHKINENDIKIDISRNRSGFILIRLIFEDFTETTLKVMVIN